MQYSPKLKKAMEEIKVILNKYDVGASVVLHTPIFSEFLLKVDPSYSCAKFENNELRIRSKLEDYNGDKTQQELTLTNTVNMIVHLSDTNKDIIRMLDAMIKSLSLRMEININDGGSSSHTQQNN